MSSAEDPTTQRHAPAVTAEGEAFVSAPSQLRYFAGETPTHAAVEVARGVRWVRIPLPIDLDHINVWLIDAPGGCIIVDTGMAAPVCTEAWDAIAPGIFSAGSPQGVFVTHIHPDHIGLAAWLQERYRAPVQMSARTYEMAQMILGASPAAPFSATESFFLKNGVTDFAAVLPMLKPAGLARMASGLPQVERCIAGGETVHFEAPWIALETNGHAEGHLCLWNAAARVLISGDQVLPTISSNISFTPHSKDLNPLGSYLESLQRLRALPADTLVLPSHGVPFYGLQQRIDDLISHHEEQLAIIINACAEPRSAAELMSLMFRRKLKGLHLYLALGEALAHLEYLVHAGKLAREEAGAVVRYRRLP